MAGGNSSVNVHLALNAFHSTLAMIKGNRVQYRATYQQVRKQLHPILGILSKKFHTGVFKKSFAFQFPREVAKCPHILQGNKMELDINCSNQGAKLQELLVLFIYITWNPSCHVK